VTLDGKIDGASVVLVDIDAIKRNVEQGREDRRQRTEDRRQRTEDRGQKTEDRGEGTKGTDGGM
jgi:hypothetical protein